jgi:hypothetical protein
MSSFAIIVAVVISVACASCSRPPSYLRVAGGTNSIRTWPLGEVRPCVSVRVTFSDGVPEEPILYCDTEEEVDNMIDLKQTGLLKRVGHEQRETLHKEPVLAVTTAHPERDKWRCRKTSDGINCVGEDEPRGERPSLEERRLMTWVRNLPESDDRLGKAFDKICKDLVKHELEIAAYNRSHPPSDQRAQVTDLRKQTCGGPDGPGENQPASRAPAK